MRLKALLITLLLLFPTPVLAVTSNSVVTKVGNPVGPPPNSSSIVDAANAITPLLYKIQSREFPILVFAGKTDEPGLYYWCDFLPIDSYRNAGNSDWNRQTQFGYNNMVSYFKTTPGYEFLGPNTPVEQVKPGAVIFFGSGSFYHVAIVSSVIVDSDGDGQINTLDSNNVSTTDFTTVLNHIAQRANTTQNLFGVSGFGQKL